MFPNIGILLGLENYVPLSDRLLWLGRNSKANSKRSTSKEGCNTPLSTACPHVFEHTGISKGYVIVPTPHSRLQIHAEISVRWFLKGFTQSLPAALFLCHSFCWSFSFLVSTYGLFSLADFLPIKVGFKYTKYHWGWTLVQLCHWCEFYGTVSLEKNLCILRSLLNDK